MKLKTYNVYWAYLPGDYVTTTTVKAKQRRSAEKLVRAEKGQNIIIDSVTEAPTWTYTMDLISQNID